MTLIGHNQPPSILELGKEVEEPLGLWLKENPVIQDEDKAREGKVLVDRAALHLQDLESERKARTGLLNDQVKAINGAYKQPREFLKSLLSELKDRLNAYIKAEEARRQEIAKEAARLAQEAEARAREAEERECEAKEDAGNGACTDISRSIAEADAAFSEYEQAARAARLADNSTQVRIGGGLRRSLSNRTKEILTVTDATKALADIGITERILDCLLTEGRDYRKRIGRLPAGIESRKERGL